ncbi:hypothetical protein [Clostridium perfringens]|uniref:hypothetical protein n=1 Tax=Clostridium perfringens TaxID=1502 RepID=UPI001B83D5AB|nr:hypothetical protein [Clostridium perfringens]HBC2034854.1 hypothetical protein [Clostridium perfringens]HBC2058002.1 hypothetical protein [Clostridium perfringens]HBC2072205.1 hypothetical protein [Clostridium perfringens]
MEEYKSINAILTDTEKTLYVNQNGIIIKTILLYNSKSEAVNTTIKFDDTSFSFNINQNETKVISSPIFSKSIKAFGDGVNIHVTGLQL